MLRSDTVHKNRQDVLTAAHTVTMEIVKNKTTPKGITGVMNRQIWSECKGRKREDICKISAKELTYGQ